MKKRVARIRAITVSDECPIIEANFVKATVDISDAQITPQTALIKVPEPKTESEDTRPRREIHYIQDMFGHWEATISDLPMCIIQGRTLSETRTRASDVLNMCTDTGDTIKVDEKIDPCKTIEPEVQDVTLRQVCEPMIPGVIRMKPDKVKKFLMALSEKPTVARAARAAGITSMQAYGLRNRYPTFAAAWDAAIADSADKLIVAMWDRAVKGVREPVYQGGKEVGSVRRFSDELAKFLGKGYVPERFRERFDMMQSGPNGGPIQSEVKVTINFVKPGAPELKP